MRRVSCVFAVAALVFSFSAAVPADVFLKQKHHADPYVIMGQKMQAVDRVQSVWFTKDRARVDQTADTSMIIRLDRKKMLVLFHASKTYAETPLADIQETVSQAMDDEGMSGEEKAQAQAMMAQMTAMMKPAITVQETKETKKIKSWNCQKYLMTMTISGITMTSEIWATTDIKADYSFYNKVMNVYLSKMPGMQEAMKEVEKIKGFMALMTSKGQVMGAQTSTTEELIEINEKSGPPAGGYDVPAGYKKINK
jgi:hypothetical protein